MIRSKPPTGKWGEEILGINYIRAGNFWIE